MVTGPVSGVRLQDLSRLRGRACRSGSGRHRRRASGGTRPGRACASGGDSQGTKTGRGTEETPAAQPFGQHFRGLAANQHSVHGVLL